MNSRVVVFAILCIAILVSAVNFVNGVEPGETNAEAVAPRHPIWVIESPTSKTYLLGSIHVLRESDYPLPEVFYAAYDDAERIVMEIDINGIDPSSSFKFTRDLAMLPEKSTLETVIGRENYAQILQLGQANKIGMRKFDHFDPWYAAMTVTQIQLQRMGYRSDMGVEVHFANKAKEDNKPEIGLETLEQQLGFLDQLSIETQTEFLLQSLADSEELRQEGEAALAAWKSGNLEKLYALLADSLDENPELRSTLLIERNRRWLPQLIEFTRSHEDHLVIVGALHLGGNDGLITMLTDAGFTLRQL